MVKNSVLLMLRQLVSTSSACETQLVEKVAVCAENVLERSTGDLRETLNLWISSLGRGVGPCVRRGMVLGVARVGGVAPR